MHLIAELTMIGSIILLALKLNYWYRFFLNRYFKIIDIIIKGDMKIFAISVLKKGDGIIRDGAQICLIIIS